MSDELDEILGLAKNEAPQLPSDNQMHELSSYVSELVKLRNRIEMGEKLLSTLREEELKLSREIIPSKLDEIGFMKVVLPSGQSVSYKPFYSGKIQPEREPEAYEWLEQNGHGGAIKGEAIFVYRRAERDDVLEMLRKIKELFDRDATVKLGVHHSTLRALIREVTEEGGTFPPDLFNVFIGRQTEIK